MGLAVQGHPSSDRQVCQEVNELFNRDRTPPAQNTMGWKERRGRDLRTGKFAILVEGWDSAPLDAMLKTLHSHS